MAQSSQKAEVVRMFSPEMRSKYARENPATPTGVRFPWRGAVFNLMPFEMGELLEVAEIIDNGRAMLQNLAGIQSAIAGSAVSVEGVDVIAGVLQYIAGKAPEIVYKMRDHLAKSPGVCDAGTAEENAEDRAAFDAWFLEQDAKAMALAFLPKIREVFGNHPLETPTPASDEAAPILLETTPTSST